MVTKCTAKIDICSMMGFDLAGPVCLTPTARKECQTSPAHSYTRVCVLPCIYISTCLSEATSSVLYLRTLLRALDWAATNQYDVRALLEKMLTTAKNVGALYNVFFDR